MSHGIPRMDQYSINSHSMSQGLPFKKIPQGGDTALAKIDKNKYMVQKIAQESIGYF